MIGLNTWRWVLDLGWLLFLLIIFRHFWRDRQVLVQAQTWLQVKGRITACEWTKVGHSVWPKIEYTYQVYDKNLTGEYLFLDTAHNNPNSKYSRGVAYKAAIAFQENAEIDVYYNPNHPEQSALDVTIPTKLNIILILIGMLIVVHLGLIAWRYLA
ncbi:DUF3592 domain-containing protein [Legionella bozemanae]|uniref:DUF3592 domain-containing protein n=1 Tax=Legionella bozemanae TaxID=447 RepID=A0A0W0RXG4_LEGBO|nr:DUF3592 domain-containing protein [Legionella bozemanae]KTC75839.1 hypothetical protein Lboz_0667 [Legionella bozemanae]STO35538.1 Protein of uncharacterised function (DUF3592) [Legionella bozemanae]